MNSQIWIASSDQVVCTIKWIYAYFDNETGLADWVKSRVHNIEDSV